MDKDTVDSHNLIDIKYEVLEVNGRLKTIEKLLDSLMLIAACCSLLLGGILLVLVLKF